MQTKLIIADDHEIVRNGLCRLFESDSQYQVISAVANAKKLIEQCQQKLPDLVIIDLSMPGMGGVELIRRLQLKWPLLKIVVFSIYQNPQLVQKLFEMGVVGYVSKSCSTKVILSCIAAIVKGETFISPDININIKNSSSLSKLSAREFDIFCCVGRGLTSKQISEKLFLSEKTIANNISLIKKKLNVITQAEMLHTALIEGVLFSD